MHLHALCSTFLTVVCRCDSATTVITAFRSSTLSKAPTFEIINTKVAKRWNAKIILEKERNILNSLKSYFHRKNS